MSHHLRNNGDLRVGFGRTVDFRSGGGTMIRIPTLHNQFGDIELTRSDLEAIRDWCERELAVGAPVVEERRLP